MYLKTMWTAGLLTLAACLGAAPTPIIIHVSPDGSDGFSGRLAEPNAARTDGPVASLAGARDAIRRLRAGNRGRDVPITVRIRGGVYQLETPLVIEPQDSGTTQAPVIYEAQPGQRPIVTGGQVITGFAQNGPLWQAKLPKVAEGKWYFRQLWVGGQRRQRARAPNTGYFRIAEPIEGPVDPQSRKPIVRDRFRFAPGDLKPWQRLEDVNLILMHSWENSIHPLKSVDTAANIVEFAAPLKEWWGIAYWERNQRYYVENARELLDAPGEWYLDRQTGVLSYWPMPGESINQTPVVAPVLGELVRFAGNADQGQFVEHVTLRGLTFHHADWELAPGGNSSTQAAVEVPAAIMADGALHCAVERCEVAHIGTYAIWFRRGCRNGRIQQNRLFDLGAGGVRVGEAAMARTDVAESSHNLVDNNHIYDGGRVYPAGIGVWLAQASHNTISHNDIHDMLYSGISIGWNWNDAPNRTHHNIIEHNHVHHLVHGVLSDAGLIYCLGVSPGSVIRYNLFHDIWPYDSPPFGWGIYLDATCGGYLVENNVVYNTRSGGLMYNNGGHEHVIRNNIFAFSANYALWPYWEKRPNTFQRNIVYMTQGELFVPFASSTLKQRVAAGESVGTWDHNVYWHAQAKRDLKFFRSDFDAWRKMGLDGQSALADPLFVDAEAYDFALKADSPALKLGFKPIDISRAGLYGEADWVNEPRQRRHAKTVLPAPPPAPKMTEVDDGFEDTAVGQPPRASHVDPESRGASIRVTDQHAAAGKRSLLFTDRKALQPSWMPHMFYQPHMTSGTVRQSFDLRLEQGANLFTEWRDETDYPRCIGPSVSFDESGRVAAGGKALTTIPVGQWVHIEIEAAIGASAPRRFRLTVGTPDGQRQIFPDLPFRGPEFRELHWLGFSSTAAADCVFYLDNLKVKRVAP